MTFTLGIPADGQSLGNSKPQVRGNFTTIFNTMAINHVAFNTLGEGKHKFLQMPEQGSAPATAANEGGLYTKEAQSITNLFWRLENNGTEVQMTNIAPSNASSGYSFLPGGLLIQWGKVVGATDGTSVTYPVAFSATAYSVQLTFAQAVGTSITLSVGAGAGTNATAFNLRMSISTTLDVFWVAIGPKT